jgi:hypothetical protein
MTKYLLAAAAVAAIGLALTLGAANAAPLKLTLNESAFGSGLVRQTHVYKGTRCHSECSGNLSHNNRVVKDPLGPLRCVTHSPCIKS